MSKFMSVIENVLLSVAFLFGAGYLISGFINSESSSITIGCICIIGSMIGLAVCEIKDNIATLCEIKIKEYNKSVKKKKQTDPNIEE